MEVHLVGLIHGHYVNLLFYFVNRKEVAAWVKHEAAVFEAGFVVDGMLLCL